MPYKCTKLHIPRDKDRRIKLTDDERVEIKELYGKVSQRKLAKRFEVSRRLIQFIGDPSKKARDIELRKLRGGSRVYYDREKHNLAMKDHRRYKQKLYLKGDLNVA